MEPAGLCGRCTGVAVPLRVDPRADLLQNGLVGSPCSPRDSQESSPTPQFKSINSSVLSILYGPTLHKEREKKMTVYRENGIGCDGMFSKPVPFYSMGHRLDGGEFE